MNKVRFGIIGTNFIADRVLAAARADARFEAVAVCSRTQARADEFAQKHAIAHTFTSLERMVESELVDAVYIATPNSLHAAQSILCMRHGKHVLCEKPLASNAREARAMIAAARQYGVVLMEAMITTLNPNFRIVRDALSRLGPIRRYFASYCQYSSRYDRFKAGELPNTFNPAFSNGAAMDIGIYTIYPMVALFGRPATIQAQGVLLPSGVDAQGAVNFGYEGMNATVIYSKIADSSLASEIQGEQGSLLLDAIQIPRSVILTRRGGVPANTGSGIRSGNAGSGVQVETFATIHGKPVPLRIGETLLHDPYYYEVTEFLDLIEQGRMESTCNSHANSLATLEIIDEIRRQLGVVYPSDEPTLEN